jgi:hypothetical protein
MLQCGAACILAAAADATSLSSDCISGVVFSSLSVGDLGFAATADVAQRSGRNAHSA